MGGISSVLQGLSSSPSQGAGLQQGLVSSNMYGTFGSPSQSAQASEASSVFQNQNLSPIFSTVGQITGGTSSSFSKWLPYLVLGIFVVLIFYLAK